MLKRITLFEHHAHLQPNSVESVVLNKPALFVIRFCLSEENKKNNYVEFNR